MVLDFSTEKAQKNPTLKCGTSVLRYRYVELLKCHFLSIHVFHLTCWDHIMMKHLYCQNIRDTHNFMDVNYQMWQFK